MPSKKKKPEPEPEPPEDEEEDDGKDAERSRKRNLLLSRKKRMVGYRTRAKQSGIGKNTVLARVFTNADVRRMMRFSPPNKTLCYSAEEYKLRRTLAATPVPPSAAQAMAPTVDALAKRICENAARAAYAAGRPALQPYDILMASRGILDTVDFSVLDADGLARFAQSHDARGRPVDQRDEDEEARVPMMDAWDRDAECENDDRDLLKEYSEIDDAVTRWEETFRKKKPPPMPSAPVSAPAPPKKKKKTQGRVAGAAAAS